MYSDEQLGYGGGSSEHSPSVLQAGAAGFDFRTHPIELRKFSYQLLLDINRSYMVRLISILMNRMMMTMMKCLKNLMMSNRTVMKVV